MEQYNFLLNEKDVYECFKFYNHKHSDMVQSLKKQAVEVHDKAENKFQAQWDLEVSHMFFVM